MAEPILVIDRKSGAIVEEKILGDRLLRTAYQSPFRPLLRALFFRTGWCSRLLGCYCDSRWSRRKIGRTVRELAIDTDEIREPLSSFRTFNEFFCRRLRPEARPFDPAPDVLVSPADCRLLVYPMLDADTCVPVKGRRFTIPRLLDQPETTCAGFRGGAVAVARLCPADYHRYHFPTSGRVVDRRRINGRYDSVNPLALAVGVPVFTENVRVVTDLELEIFGVCAFVEVGAFGVAGIEETHSRTTFVKMDEKGCFRFGGSTIVLVLAPGAAVFSPDLVANSARGFETLVQAGQTVAVAREPRHPAAIGPASGSH